MSRVRGFRGRDLITFETWFRLIALLALSIASLDLIGGMYRDDWLRKQIQILEHKVESLKRAQTNQAELEISQGEMD